MSHRWRHHPHDLAVVNPAGAGQTYIFTLRIAIVDTAITHTVTGTGGGALRVFDRVGDGGRR